MNPELGTIRTALMRSYDGLPYHLKSYFLYMPIFPEDYRVRRARLARWWSAEGYSREVRGRSAEEIADSYFMELISRSMLLPSQISSYGRKGIDSCQVHDLMREIGISKSIEENLVFTLEEGCSSKSQATMRHLAINGNWKGVRSELESLVDMSRVRSITIFGESKSFFISDKMKLLRVLDFEDTTGLCDHHLKHIGKFLHLRYLSLRGCSSISHLLDSLGSLRKLETLDIRGTQIVMLPKTIIKLRKLNSLHASKKQDNEDVSWEGRAPPVPKVLNNRPCALLITVAVACAFWCAPQLLVDDYDDDVSRWHICSLLCYNLLPAIVLHLDMHGILVPKGMRKLKALHTLGVVNIGRHGKDVLNEIKELIRLRKLRVTEVNKENGQELCSTIVGLSHLESLFIRSEGKPGLSGCLDGTLSFPESLQSLKLYGNLVKFPEWIQGLKNLVKLKLRSCRISEHDTTMQVLGDLPNLASLHLLHESFEQSNACLNFHPGMFPSMVVLELARLWILPGCTNNPLSLKFEQGATPKLEQLMFRSAEINSKSLSGLPSLASLKEVLLEGSYDDTELVYLRDELAENPSRPVVKMV